MNYLHKTKIEIFKLELTEGFALFHYQIENQKINFILNHLKKIFDFYQKNSGKIFFKHCVNLKILIKILKGEKKEKRKDFQNRVSPTQLEKESLLSCADKKNFKKSHLSKKTLSLFRPFQEIFLKEIEFELKNQRKISTYNTGILDEIRKGSQTLGRIEARYSRYLILSQVILNFLRNEEFLNFFFEEDYEQKKVIFLFLCDFLEF